MAEHVRWVDLGLEAFLRNVKTLGDLKVRIGVVGEAADASHPGTNLTVGEVAIINEYGTKDGHVPARSFLRGAIHPQRVFKEAAKVADAVVQFRDPTEALAMAGKALAMLVQEELNSTGLFLPNAPSTIQKKGVDFPLHDTGVLAEAVGYVIVHERPTEEYASFEVSGV